METTLHIDNVYKAYVYGLSDGKRVSLPRSEENFIKYVKNFYDSSAQVHNGPNNTLYFDVDFTIPENLDDELCGAIMRGKFDINGVLSVEDREAIFPVKYLIGTQTIPPHNIVGKSVIFNGINALDFLDKIYEDKYLPKTTHNYNKYCQLKFSHDKYPLFRWAKTKPNAISPSKNRASDSGYDLYLLEKIKERKGVVYYDTGIKVNPSYGYYFDLVGRSSISKTGWMLANNVGIIDAGYTGSIIVALVRSVPNAPEITLPNKLVQLVPRRLFMMNSEEVRDTEISDTSRRDSGGLGSGTL